MPGDSRFEACGQTDEYIDATSSALMNVKYVKFVEREAYWSKLRRGHLIALGP
jgi:hypothetical protein